MKKMWENPHYRKHMSEAHKGQVSHMKGKRHAKETIEKIKQNNGKGMKGKRHTKEAREKIIKANIERWKDPNSVFNSKEFRKKMSESQKKRLSDPKNHHFYKKHHKEETKMKISNANKGNIPWNKGLKNIYSEEAREKMSISHKGNIPWNRKEIICINDCKIFECKRLAGEFYNIKSYNNIAKCCAGVIKSCGKSSNGIPLKWMYYEDYLKTIK